MARSKKTSKMLILITFLSTNFRKLKEFWIAHKSSEKGSLFYGTDVSPNFDLGGAVILLEWKTKKVLKYLKLNTPAGIDIDLTSKKIFISINGTDILILNDKLNPIRSISNPFLNDIHSISLTNKGILVSSTGIDALIEIDLKGNMLFDWFAVEHGYKKDPKGRERMIPKNIDHRAISYPTMRHTTHLNSALYIGKTKLYKETIICTLFHQGEVIAIDRSTKNFSTVIKGLKKPHSLDRIAFDLLMLSNTANNEIIIFNRDFEIKKRVKIRDAEWIQDAICLSNGNFLVADANHNRILEVNEFGEIIDSYNFNKDWKIFKFKELKL